MNEELTKEELTNGEIKNRAADAHLFYRNHFKKYLADKEMEWLRSLGEKDWTKDSKEHTEWHQGALHCLREINNWFKNQVEISKLRFNKEEEPEKGVAIPPIEQ